MLPHVMHHASVALMQYLVCVCGMFLLSELSLQPFNLAPLAVVLTLKSLHLVLVLDIQSITL